MKIMKTIPAPRTVHRSLLAALLVGLSVVGASGQFVFNSGSTGTVALNITTDTTLPLPPDGILHYTTITVATNRSLTFSNNLLNTPVYLLASGNVTIHGTISVSGWPGTATFGGVAGPGGFAGGSAGMAGLPAGDGYGPGAGRAGTSTGWNQTNSAGYASYGTPTDQFSYGKGSTYGSPLLVPLVGGSGGGGNPSWGGSGGGGAILIASSTSITVRGNINSRPGSYVWQYSEGLGSGGAIRLVAPVVSGTGNLNVDGANYGYTSGAGRIRIDCMDRRTLALNYVPASVASVGGNMLTFLSAPPRLDITQAAGNSIVVGTGVPVFFMLPENSSTNQSITIQARNFGAPVPIRVVLTPDNGPASSYDTQIDNSTVNPASVTVPVVVPVNVQVQVNAWTR